MTELQNKAFQKIFYLIRSEIADKHVVGMHNYIQSLSEKELKCCINIAQRLYDKKTIKGTSWKVSSNAIKLCLKLAKCGIHTFPFVEKIATKGWDTSGGTYCFSMPILTDDTVNNAIYSFRDVNTLAAMKTKICVFYNENTRSQEVDLQ